jgi:hypothetical protein
MQSWEMSSAGLPMTGCWKQLRLSWGWHWRLAEGTRAFCRFIDLNREHSLFLVCNANQLASYSKMHTTQSNQTCTQWQQEGRKSKRKE